MLRDITKDLIAWGHKKDRLPLILKGARQVGKTHILKDFANSNFSKLHYINFEEKPDLKRIFEHDLVPKRILSDLRISYEQIKGNKELLFFDEIQACPKALTSLKYFAEDTPDIFVCAAGSLLGVVLSEESYPVGKVQHLYLTPFKFSEFLLAYDDWLFQVFLKVINEKSTSSFHHEKLVDAYRLYSVVGGMPKAVAKAIEYKEDFPKLFSELTTIHDDLLRSYHSDFAKHAGKSNATHIAAIFANVPSQLSRNIDGSTKRYRFKDVLPNKKGYAELTSPIDWLVKAGLIYKIKILNRPEFPLENFTAENLFKLYFFDPGLLGRSLSIPYEVLYQENYGLAKGYFAENAVLTQLIEDELTTIYCWEENKSEIEFVKVINSKIVPIEVKSGSKINSKSLRSYINRYKPECALRLSNKNFPTAQKPVNDFPIYLAERLGELVDY